jgi:hypothetical protein
MIMDKLEIETQRQEWVFKQRDAKVLQNFLNANRNETCLCIRANRLFRKAPLLALLQEHLAGATTCVDLEIDSTDDLAAFESVLALLHKLPHIKSLGISACLDVEEATVLATFLRANTTLVNFTCTHGDIRDECCEVIGAAGLCANSKIKSVNLAVSSLTDASVPVLCDLIRHQRWALKLFARIIGAQA